VIAAGALAAIGAAHVAWAWTLRTAALDGATRVRILLPATHDWPYWRRDLRKALPDLMRVLASR
jgi:S-formylglutathione hydrolase FrmB